MLAVVNVQQHFKLIAMQPKSESGAICKVKEDEKM